MGLARPRAAVLTLVAASLAAAAAPAADAPTPLAGMRWIAPGADPVRAFATSPPECLALPADPSARNAVEIGRAAFRSPLVLGGQAARAGISCETCHRAGRGNPDFLFPNVSGAPGTADVTSSLFSSHRGNGVFDPRLIPDLGGARATLKVDRAAPGRLEGFVHGLVTEEFDGPEPPAAVLAGLAAYVRALRPEACGDTPTPIDVTSLMADARRALAAARSAPDPQTARAMIRAAQARLALVEERFGGAGFSRLQNGLAGASAVLGEMAQTSDPRAAGIEKWVRMSKQLEAGLKAQEAASLFDPHRLAEAANGRLPAPAS